MSAPASALSLSYFASARDNQPKPLTSSWDDLAQSLAEVRTASCTPETCLRSECPDKHGPAWSPALYPEGANRSRSAVVEVSTLVLDIDHVKTDEDLAAVVDRIAYAKIVHSSHSDRPGDRCVRVIVQLSRPVLSREWPHFWNAVIKKLDIPVDQQTKDASRLYFLPSRPTGATATEFGDGTDYLFAAVEGAPIDVDALLLEFPAQETRPEQETRNVSVTTSKTGRDAALDLLSQAWPAQGRHQASLALAGALAHADWTQEQIAQFLHDLMDLVYGPGADTNARKRDDQARDSYNKKRAGEPVNGWPTLIPHVGEQTVTEVTKHLGIGGKPGWVDALLKLAKDAKPTHDQLVSHYALARKRLVRQTANFDAQIEAKVLKRILDHEQLAEGDEDRTSALVTAIRTLVKYAPQKTETHQLSSMLVHVFPVNVGQDEGAAWSDTLTALVDQCIETIAEEARTDGEFDVEVSGLRTGKPRNTTHNMDVAFKKMGVLVRYDEFANTEVIKHGDLDWQTIEDHHLTGLRIEIEEKFDFKLAKDEFFDYVTHRARKNSFHPVRDYLDSLEWDGVPRIGNWLATYGGAADTEYTRAVGRLVLIAACRRVRQPGCKFDEMLILEGEQGVQKSSALKALCPHSVWFSDDLPLDADTKRFIESTRGRWIVEAGELKGMSKKDIGTLKGSLSRMVDSARMSYGRKETLAPRQFIIIGTTNDAHYLRDATGNRRFWPVLVVLFDLVALERDRDQMWAEAAHYEALGESIRLDPKYYALAEEEQEERRVVGSIEAMLEEAFTGVVGRIRILDMWGLFGKDPIEARPEEEARMGESMRRMGWERTRLRVGAKRPYFYVKGTEEERNIALVVSGRKVVAAAGAPPPAVPLAVQLGKVN